MIYLIKNKYYKWQKKIKLHVFIAIFFIIYSITSIKYQWLHYLRLLVSILTFKLLLNTYYYVIWLGKEKSKLRPFFIDHSRFCLLNWVSRRIRWSVSCKVLSLWQMGRCLHRWFPTLYLWQPAVGCKVIHGWEWIVGGSFGKSICKVCEISILFLANNYQPNILILT